MKKVPIVEPVPDKEESVPSPVAAAQDEDAKLQADLDRFRDLALRANYLRSRSHNQV